MKLFLFLLLLTTQAFATRTFVDLEIKFGTGTTANNLITSDQGLGASNPQIKWNTSTGFWQFCTSGSCTNIGAPAITALTGDVTASGSGSVAATIAANAVTNAKAAQMAAHTFKGNNTGSTANSIDLTATQLTAELNAFTSLLQGLVPASGGGTTTFLRADGTFAVPPVGSFTPSAQSSGFTAATGFVYITTGAFNVQLPSPSSGILFYVKKTDSSIITLVRAASETIEGVAASYTVGNTKQSVTVFCDGTNWWII